VVDNAVECLEACQSFAGLDTDIDGTPDLFCNWFSYDKISHTCDFLDSCQPLEEECSTCIIGSVECSPEVYSTGVLKKLGKKT